MQKLTKTGAINILRRHVYNLIKLNPDCTEENLVDWCWNFLVNRALDASEIGFILDELTTSGEITKVLKPTYSVKE
jgi:hypothetical protein